MQGGQWDKNISGILDSEIGVLFSEMPVIWIEPVDISYKINKNDYECPLYKTSLRAGELSTTGHSTNFVMFLYLNSGSEEPNHWIRKGVALLCLLD